MAQTNVSGNVVDAESNEPLVGASIIIKDDNGKIIKFTTTKDLVNFFICDSLF